MERDATHPARTRLTPAPTTDGPDRVLHCRDDKTERTEGFEVVETRRSGEAECAGEVGGIATSDLCDLGVGRVGLEPTTQGL